MFRRQATDPGSHVTVTVRSSLRAAITGTADATGRLMAANLVWLSTATLAVTAGATYRPAYVLSPLVVPVTCGIIRMAGHAARRDLPRLRQFREGARQRLPTHLALGTGQCVVLMIAIVNIGVGMAGDSLLFALITVTAGYVALATVVLAAALWPLLLDPDRHDMGVPAVLRLAIAVVMRRPLSLVVIALVEILLLGVIAEVVVLGVILPTFGALIATNFVLPVADDLQGRIRSTRRAGIPVRTLEHRTGTRSGDRASQNA